MNQFMWGALWMACCVAAVFFLRFWRLSRDRFFIFFALAFATFAAHWFGLGVANPGVETRHYFYVFRLVAFLLILVGIIDKNRTSSTSK
jgi:hypothetical protein